MCIVSCKAVTTERLPSSEVKQELGLIIDNQWRWLFTDIVQRPREHAFSGSNVNDNIPLCVQWALDETLLQQCFKEKRMHAADPSEQVCLRMSNDKRQLAATPCGSRSGEVVRMHMNTRRKPARLYINILLGCLLHDGVYQDHNGKMVQTQALFERLLWKLAEKVRRIREQHHLPENGPVIVENSTQPIM